MTQPARIFQKLLREALQQARRKNPSYSMRALARKLRISPASLSHYLNGKKSPSRRTAFRILEQLDLTATARSDILKQFTRVKFTDRRYHELDRDRFHLIAQWQHFAILSLAETRSFESDPDWIAERLGIPSSLARESMDRLLRLELLRYDGKKLVATGESYGTTDGIPDLALRKMNAHTLDMAKACFFETPFSQWDYTAMTMAIDPTKLPEAGERIRVFRDKLCAWLESGEKREVYQMSMQLFPLSRVRSL